MPEIIDQSLNTTHITSNINQYEAARSNFFVFQVAPDQLNNLVHPDFDTSTGEPNSADLYNGQLVSDYLRLNVVKANVPNFKLGSSIVYTRGNDVVKMAGKPEFSDGEITVDDVVGLHIKDMLYSWLYLAYDPHTRKTGRMADYKKTATLLEYTADYKLIRYWILDGCFVTSIDESPFDREGDADKRQLTVAISFDRSMMYTQHDAI